MRVIVVGCGRVGSGLAVRLQQDGHAVAIIDKAANAFRRLPDEWGGQTVVGFGFDRDVLLEAGIHEANALAAVTSGDNSNILAARIARETFEIPHVVARIKSPSRAVIYQRLGIPTVATVSWAVDQVMRRLLPEEGVTAWTDPTGEINMVEHLLPESFCGHSYAELTDGDEFKPVLVTRGGQCRLVGPGTVGQEGDLVHFAVRTSAVSELERRLGEAHAAWGGRRRGRRDDGAVGVGDAASDAASPGAAGADAMRGGRSA
jgi:trk system potassium uptake protein TrkA